MKSRRTRTTILVTAGALAVVLLPVTRNFPGASAATPDQPQIGFASGESPAAPDESDPVDIYVANADGSGKVNLTTGYGSTWQWAWSPDGSQIAFVSHDAGTAKLYVRPLSGPAPFPVATAPDTDAPIRWSPDGASIAFVSAQDGNSEIYLADVATRTARNVSRDALSSFDPRWSPTGSHLAYTVRGDGGAQDEDIYIVARSGGPPVNVTNDTAASHGGAWSPDGSHFVFVATRDGNDDIYVADGDGRNPVRLTNDPANDRDPAWSPDGSQIAFSSGLETLVDHKRVIVVPSRIYVMDADGSNRRQVTDGSIDPSPVPDWGSLTHAAPKWSPDGTRLAVFVTVIGGGPLARLFTAYTVDAGGGGTPIKVWDGGGSMSWSPDSSMLAIVQIHVVGNTSVIVPATGGPVVEVGHGFGTGPATWSTYGTHSAAMSGGNAAGPGDVFVAAPDGTDPMSITNDLPGPHNGAEAWRPQPVGPVGLVDTSAGRWHLGDAWGWIRSFYYGNPGDLPFMGDWDCDGIETPGLFREQDAFVYLRNSNTQGVADIRFFFGNPQDVPLAGDFNGDGCDTVSIYRPTEQRFYIINALGKNEGGLGAADYSFAFGDPADVPVVGDWDGDGIDEIGLFRPSTGFFYHRNTLDTGIADAKFYFGDPGDRFVAGDWGVVDGVDTPAVFRPITNTFYFRHTNTAGVADSRQTWPSDATSWIPVAGIES